MEEMQCHAKLYSCPQKNGGSTRRIHEQVKTSVWCHVEKWQEKISPRLSVVQKTPTPPTHDDSPGDSLSTLLAPALSEQSGATTRLCPWAYS